MRDRPAAVLPLTTAGLIIGTLAGWLLLTPRQALTHRAWTRCDKPPCDVQESTTVKNLNRSAAALLGLTLTLLGCDASGASSSRSEAGADDCVTGYAEGRDYFPDKSTVDESELWDITYHNSYKTITVTDTETPGGDKLVYALYQCGTPQPAATGDLEGALFIQVPVTNVAVTSFNALAIVDRLGKSGTITALSGQLLGNGQKDEWYARVIKAAGQPMSIGEYTDLHREVVLGLKNQIILMSGFGQGFDDITNARAAGLPGVSVSNRMERHALASAEWIKMVAAFYNAEAVHLRTRQRDPGRSPLHPTRCEQRLRPRQQRP